MSPDQLWLFLDRLGFNLLAVLATGLALHALLGIADMQRWSRGIIVVVLSSVLFALGRLLMLNAELGGGIASALDTAMLPFAWATLRDTTQTLLAGGALILAGAVLRSRWLAGAGGFAMAASFALTGHSLGAEPTWLIRPGLAAHVLIAGFWLAAPATLFPAGEHGNASLPERLERFSRVAVVAIPALAALGLFLGWRIAGGWQPLLTTAYGWLILSKLGLTALAMALGAINKFHLTSLVRREPQRGMRLLALVLRIEAALFVAALATVSLATTILPPGE